MTDKRGMLYAIYYNSKLLNFIIYLLFTIDSISVYISL